MDSYERVFRSIKATVMNSPAGESPDDLVHRITTSALIAAAEIDPAILAEAFLDVSMPGPKSYREAARVAKFLPPASYEESVDIADTLADFVQDWQNIISLIVHQGHCHREEARAREKT
jgi:hypothetical protein